MEHFQQQTIALPMIAVAAFLISRRSQDRAKNADQNCSRFFKKIATSTTYSHDTTSPWKSFRGEDRTEV